MTGSTADLYHIMIYMFLNPLDSDCSGTCPENLMFPGQGLIQVGHPFPISPLSRRHFRCCCMYSLQGRCALSYWARVPFGRSAAIMAVYVGTC